jgi:cytochrome b involved in lipid metabolism
LALYKVGTLAPGSETPLTTATPTVAPSARMFTLAQVRRHHTAAHCWTTLAKNVYDLSPVLKRHPRATSVRVLCGRSVTKAFIKKHGGVAKTARDLKRWRIGGLGVASTPPTTPTVTYTLANVATHATDASCWSVVSSNVYDLTQWIAQHPGGKAPITAMCGKDGTASFLSVHKGQAGPATALARFKIGALA